MRPVFIALPIIIALLWLASLYGAYRVGYEGGSTFAFPPERVYTDCKTFFVYRPGDEAPLNAAEANGYQVTRSDPTGNGVARLVTACR